MFLKALRVQDSDWLSQRQYRKWCKKKGFESMLPDDTKQRREAASDSGLQTQTDISNHLTEVEVIPYSDQAFQDASIQWLVHTNQVCFLSCYLSSLGKLALTLVTPANSGVQQSGVQEDA